MVSNAIRLAVYLDDAEDQRLVEERTANPAVSITAPPHQQQR
jgi:hypothetical protein